MGDFLKNIPEKIAKKLLFLLNINHLEK